VLSNVYLAAQLVVLPVALVWLYRRSRPVYRRLRDTVIATWLIAVPIFALFPVAPPRLAGIGIVDTVSRQAGVGLTGRSTLFYNPFAAVPSLHFGYALLVGVTIGLLAGNRVVRAIGWSYPIVMLLVIVATGNHFFFDAAGGAFAIGAGFLFATWVGAPDTRVRRWQSAPGSAPALN
jgi:PAP2 superfamily